MTGVILFDSLEAMKNLIFQENYLSPKQREEFISYLEGLQPLWENRFSKHNPPSEGDQQRRLLRPVYWLGNWQFACLNYYHPPKGIENRCVEAEPFPGFMQKVVDETTNALSTLREQLSTQDSRSERRPNATGNNGAEQTTDC